MVSLLASSEQCDQREVDEVSRHRRRCICFAQTSLKNCFVIVGIQPHEGAALSGVRFRYALLTLDIATVLFIITTSFLPRSRITESFDVLLGVLILADFTTRLLISAISAFSETRQRQIVLRDRQRLQKLDT